MTEALWFWPLLGGLGVALFSGPLGSFMVWQRLSFLGDTLAHAALLGVAFSLIFSLDLWIGLLVISVLFAVGLAISMEKPHTIPTDGLLMLLSQGAFAGSLIAISLKGVTSVDLMGYLVGDILTLNAFDSLVIWAGGGLILLVLFLLWKPLLSLTVHEELVAVEGYSILGLRLLFLTLLALAIAVTLKMMGALLLSTLLIAPALAVRPFVKTPEQMCVMASLVGMIAVGLGIDTSFRFDIPTGPGIAAWALAFFMGFQLVSYSVTNRYKD